MKRGKADRAVADLSIHDVSDMRIRPLKKKGQSRFDCPREIAWFKTATVFYAGGIVIFWPMKT